MVRTVWNGASKRKLRLLFCGCSRLQGRRLRAIQRRVIEIGERYADGLLSEAEFEKARRTTGRGAAYQALVLTLIDDITNTLLPVFDQEYLEPRKSRNCEIARDIFGNPFRPVTLDPRWQTSTVVDLAAAIYQERAFDRMPILADALMDAGCDNDDILNHCRGPGPHVRGCWPLDLLLGNE
jgi:hypothetical protein